MTLQETIKADYKQAMIDKDPVKKIILNYVIAQAKNKEIEVQKKLEDSDLIKIIKKEVKAIAEAIWFLEKVDKPQDLLEEQSKKTILEAYLPQTKSKEETKKIVEDIIASQWITDLKTQRWQLMWAIMGNYSGEIEWSMVNEIVNEMLA